MTIYVDEPHTWKRGFENWCHLWSDTMDLNELDRFALALGCKRSWRQCSKGMTGNFWHYDISPRKRAEALKMGAKFMSLMEWLKEQRQKAAPHD